MTVLQSTHSATPDQAAVLLAPRHDFLTEVETSPGVFEQVEGPFAHYRREVTASVPDAGGTANISEETTYRLDVPLWGPLVNVLMKRALPSLDRTPTNRWWWPREIVTTTTTRIIALLAVLAIAGGYLGVLVGQTIAFAADEFGESESAQASTLAALRIGVLISVVFIWRADRIGRKPLLIGFTAGAITFTVAGAFMQDLVSFGVTQAIGRGFTTGLLTLITLAATEEIPATMRAFILALLTLCGALGGGMVLWFLPLVDVDPSFWRITYLIPLLFLPVLLWLHREMPETRRFGAAEVTHAPGDISMRRFVMLGSMIFLLAIFSSPASQLQNTYLLNDLGFSGSQVSLFRLITSAPAGIFITLAGLIADRKGRKVIGTVGIAFGAVFSALTFLTTGLWLFVVGGLGTWFFGAAFPAMRGYQTELFPTRSRARVGGWIDVVGVSGSAVGLFASSRLIDRTGSIATAIIWLLPFAAISVLIIVVFFPETARAELEDFNPSDPDIHVPESLEL